jgi:CubicO group peptidase (beta-lactamase class C family)
VRQSQVFFILSFIYMFAASLSKCEYTYHIPQQMNDGWDVGDLTSAQIDSTLYYKFINSLPKDKKHKIHSMLVVKDNRLVFEKYFGKHDIETRHDLRSATKSIPSLLICIALEKGFTNNIDDPILDYLQNYLPLENPDAKEKITIRHLLTMSSGLACDDWDKTSPGQEDKMYSKKDWIRHVLNLPMEFAPGDTARYCTGGVILLGEIIHQASGKHVDEFAKEFLFGPLEIKNYNWSYIKKTKNVDSGGHIFMTPRDMAKIGQLVLNKGRWIGEQIVSEEWIERSTLQHTNLGGSQYGFLWWRLPFRLGEEHTTAICARGNGGQYIMVLPDAKLVAVFTGGNYNSPNAQIPLNIMGKVILPSLRDF